MSRQYIYVICEQTDSNTALKIGFSGEPEKRLKQLQTAQSNALVLYHQEEVVPENVRALERIIHKTLKHHKARGEWFHLKPDEAVAEIKHAIMRYGDIEELALKLRGGSNRV